MVRNNAANKALASVPPESTVELLIIKATLTIISGFAIPAYKNGILHPRHSKLPTNLEDIHKQVARSRRIALPTELGFKAYVKTVMVAYNKATIVVEVSRQLLKKYNNKGKYQLFNNSRRSRDALTSPRGPDG